MVFPDMERLVLLDYNLGRRRLRILLRICWFLCIGLNRLLLGRMLDAVLKNIVSYFFIKLSDVSTDQVRIE